MKAAVACLLLVACASGPTGPAVPPQAGMARIYVMRTGTAGALYSWSVLVDGLTVASLDPRSQVGVDVSPSRHVVTVIEANGGSVSLTVTPLAGETRFIAATNTGKLVEHDAARGAALVAELPRVEPIAAPH